MQKTVIMWVDDEIDMLTPHILFLEERGFQVLPFTNGHDALKEFETNKQIELAILDESMPGLTGLQILDRLQILRPGLPTVMVTKNESDEIINQAVGNAVSVYLLKPASATQVYATITTLVKRKEIVEQNTNQGYLKDYQHISSEISSKPDYKEWVNIYKRILNWEIKLGTSEEQTMMSTLQSQKSEANKAFSKFISNHYEDWIKTNSGPVLSHRLMKQKIFPFLKEDSKTIFLLLDNLRYDHWLALQPIINEVFRVEDEDYFYSILPTTTQYSRNSIFSGMLPNELAKHYPDLWKNDMDIGGKNESEEFFLERLLTLEFGKSFSFQYIKVTNSESGNSLEQNIHNYLQKNVVAIVYNFIDMVSHIRTEMEVMKELIHDEHTYRNLIANWFSNSSLWKALKKAAQKGVRLIITTDHGTIRVKRPSKMLADKETTSNLRYKVGKNLNFVATDVLATRKPADFGLPSPNISSSFVFAQEDNYFLYPNNFHKFRDMYENTFQHGGISMEEMICPVVRLVPK
jgi:DNA-binding response OmpR family regulator